jgi:4-oxalocrotonate tautomerase
MPLIQIELTAGRTPAQKAAIARAVTEAMVVHGESTPASVWVMFRDVAPHDWASGGTMLSARAAPPASNGGNNR